jgi:hypothetical protein
MNVHQHHQAHSDAPIGFGMIEAKIPLDLN